MTSGSILLDGQDVTAWAADVRSKAGLFLAFQYPESIEGVSVTQFLRQAMAARTDEDVSVLEVRVLMTEWMERLGMDSVLCQPPSQSRLQRRREEAQRDPADGTPQAPGGGARRDRLGPRHRRPAGGGSRRAHGARRADPSSGSWPSRTTSDCSTSSSPTWCTSCWTVGSSRAVGPSWPSRSRSTATRNGDDAWPFPFNVEALRKDFPLLTRTVHDRPIVYLDSASSALQPQSVHRRHDALLRDHPRQRAPGRLRHRRGSHQLLRARPDHGRSLHRRARSRP